MKNATNVTVSNEEQIPNEVMASAIVRISEAFEKVQKSGLNRRALLVLLKDASGVPMHDIGRILDVLPELSKLYTIKKAAKK